MTLGALGKRNGNGFPSDGRILLHSSRVSKDQGRKGWVEICCVSEEVGGRPRIVPDHGAAKVDIGG